MTDADTDINDEESTLDMDELASTVVDHMDAGQTIGDKIVLSRRQLLAIAGGGLSVGALGTFGVSDAQAQSAVGTIGTASNPVDVEAFDVNAQGTLTQSGRPVGVQTVSSFGNLPAIDPPQLAFVTDQNEYYHSEPGSGTPFDIASSARTFDTSINTQDADPTGIAFSASGDRLYEVGQRGDNIYQSTLSTPFNIATATFDTSINTQDSQSREIAFSATGDRLYEVGQSAANIYQSTLSTPFDIATATFDTSINTQDTFGKGIAFSASGDRLYEVGDDADSIFQSTLSTPFDIATATFDTSINTQDSGPRGVAFSATGDRLYEVGLGGTNIYQSTLSTAFDIATATFDTSINTQDSQPTGIAFSASGDRLYEVGQRGDNIYQSTLSTGGWKEF